MFLHANSGLSGLSAVCGGAAASVPTAPAGAVFAAVAHPSCCRSDAANTVPCAAGDAIRWWRDLVSGTWYEQATNGFRWVLRKDGTGWYADHNSCTARHSFLVGPTASPITYAEDVASGAFLRAVGMFYGATFNPVNSSDTGIAITGESGAQNYCLYGAIAHHRALGTNCTITTGDISSTTHTYTSSIVWRKNTTVEGTLAINNSPNPAGSGFPMDTVHLGYTARQGSAFDMVRSVVLYSGSVPNIATMVSEMQAWRGM